MTWEVTLLPGNHRFEIGARESLLDAALRVAAPVDYGCSNGNCGRCRVALIAGELEPIRHSDYRFSQEDKDRHMVLLCTHTARSNVTLSMPDLTETIAEQELTVKVRKLERVGDDILIVHVQTPRSRRLRFLAGQYASLAIPDVGTINASIASCPCDDRHLEFHLRRQPGNPLNDYLFLQLRTGTMLSVRGPMGHFTMLDSATRPMVLIAVDLGFAAIKSLLEHATAQESERTITLYRIACDTSALYLNNLCRSWEDALDEFNYRPLILSGTAADSLLGIADGNALMRHTLRTIVDRHPDLTHAEIYVSAPIPILDLARDELVDRGIDLDCLHLEPLRGFDDGHCHAETPAETRERIGE